MMDLGEDEESASAVAAAPQIHFQQQRPGAGGDSQGTKRPRVSFPDHPGPVVAMLPGQAFDMPITPQMGGSRTSMDVLNRG
jgi:hypothetical protein